MSSAVRRTVTLAALAVMVSMAFTSMSLAATVYTETNSAAGNEVQVYRTGHDGTLTWVHSVATGGRGTDAGLGSQGALALAKNGRWLFVVNAGSNDISAFAVTSRGLTWIDRVSSGGIKPVSLALHGDLLYALNAGDSGNISGFRILWNGHLQALPDSTRPLSSTTADAPQVGFDRDGDVLVVTEKATNKISVYGIDDDVPVGPTVLPSNGMTPFGFAFDRHNNLIVSEAFGGAANASAVSSYDLDEFPLSLDTISASVPVKQTAACWVVLARHGKFAYVTNTGSGTVTGFRIDRTGTLTALDTDGVTGVTGGNPVDAAVGRDPQTMYVLSPKIGKIVMFHVRADGSVVHLGSALGVPGSATGLAAR